MQRSIAQYLPDHLVFVDECITMLAWALAGRSFFEAAITDYLTVTAEGLLVRVTKNSDYGKELDYGYGCGLFMGDGEWDIRVKLLSHLVGVSDRF